MRKRFVAAAKRPAEFGRYTGRRLYPGLRDADRDQKRLKTLEYFLKIEDGARDGIAKDHALLRASKAKGRWTSKPDSFLDAFDGRRPIERNIFGATRAYYQTHPNETFFLILDEDIEKPTVRSCLSDPPTSRSTSAAIATSASFSERRRRRDFHRPADRP